MRFLWLSIICIAVAGCAPKNNVAPHDVTREILQIDNSENTAWIYYPSDIGPDEKVPCILIAGAGSRCDHGMALISEDEAEHVPYAAEGLVVVAYDTSGQLSEDPTDEEVYQAMDEFLKRRGGIDDAQAALNAAASRYSFIDTGKVYAVGHSSAGLLALTIAQEVPEIRGCVAYAPVVTLRDWLDEELVQAAEANVDGFANYLDDSSPLPNVNRIQCPLFLFHALDDDYQTVKMPDYVAALKGAGKEVTLKRVRSGGHYWSMIDPGIKLGIEWIKAQEGMN